MIIIITMNTYLRLSSCERKAYTVYKTEQKQTKKASNIQLFNYFASHLDLELHTHTHTHTHTHAHTHTRTHARTHTHTLQAHIKLAKVPKSIAERSSYLKR